MSSPLRLRPRVAASAALAVIAAGFAAVSPAQAAAPAAPAAGTVIDHPGLAPVMPATGYPVILGEPTIRQVNSGCPKGCDVPREVLAVDQVGRYIVSGGNFLSIELQNGTRISQPYFTAWSIDTKQIVCTQTTFDNVVQAIIPGDTPNSVFVAGKFTKVTGPDGITRNRSKIAKLDLTDCSVDKTFTSPTPSAKIDDLALVGNRLFVGGDFNTIGGQSISTLAQLDPTTGQVDPNFRLTFSGGISSRLRGMAVTQGGTRLVIAGRFGTVSQPGRTVAQPTAVIDITGATPSLTPHTSIGYTDRTGAAMQAKRLQDASIAPDGSVVALAYGTSTNSDYVYLTPLAEAVNTRFRWRKFMRDSSFGVGVSNNAVYVTGHFCKIDAGPGATEVMAPVPGITDSCTGANMTGGVWRSKLAALSLVDGTPFAWNPGNGSFRGGRVITVTPRGLLIGYDGERTNNVRVGALAFLDFGSANEDFAVPSDVTITSPAPGATVGSPATLAGYATDDVAIASYRLALRADDGRYVQADGTLGSYYERSVAPGADGGFALALALPPGGYTIEVAAVDVVGKVSANLVTSTFVQSDADLERPDSTIEVADAPEGVEVSFTGQATDNVAVGVLRARVVDSAGRFLQPDGTFSSSAANLPITTDVSLPAPVVGWSVAVGALPVGRYTLQMRVTDTSGNARTPQRSYSVTPAG